MQYASELKPIDIAEIKESAQDAYGCINRIYLHWTAGHYGQIYDDYHISVDHDGKIYCPDNNTNLTIHRDHTYRRNYRSIAITACGCYDACSEPYNMGSEPVTQAQIETIAVLIATICKNANVSIDSVYTHCEIAKIDGYGPYSGDPETRWDLWFLPDYDGKYRPGGDVLRGKAVWYLNNYSNI